MGANPLRAKIVVLCWRNESATQRGWTMTVAKLGVVSAVFLTLLAAIVGCESTNSSTSTSSVGSQQTDNRSSDSAVSEAPTSAVEEDPTAQGFTVAAGVPDNGLKGSAALGLTVEYLATTGLTEIGLGSRSTKNLTICIFQEPGLELPGENRINLAVLRDEVEGDKMTLTEAYEMHAQAPGYSPIDLGDKAHYGDDVDGRGPIIGETLWALKREKLVTILGSSVRESLPQGYGQDVYKMIVAKVLQDL